MPYQARTMQIIINDKISTLRIDLKLRFIKV